MKKARQKSAGKFRWNWFGPVRYVFFVFYAGSLIGVSAFISHRFSHPKMDFQKEDADSLDDSKTAAFPMNVEYRNDFYSFVVKLNKDARVAGVRRVEKSELIPQRLLPDEDLFFLSLEGRRVEDLPGFEGSNDFKTHFLIALQKLMLLHSGDKETISNVKSI